MHYVFTGRRTRSSTLMGAIAIFSSCYGTPNCPALTSSILRAKRMKNSVRNFVGKLEDYTNCIIQSLGMIKDCIWKGQRLSCSAIFTMQPTDQGMCCSFNKEKADEMFQTSPYQAQLLRLTDQDKTNSRDDSRLPEWQAQIIIL